jgi:hypothetical protein
LGATAGETALTLGDSPERAAAERVPARVPEDKLMMKSNTSTPANESATAFMMTSHLVFIEFLLGFIRERSSLGYKKKDEKQGK